MKRYYVVFVNPQSGEWDQLWFDSRSVREQWMQDFRSDFPLLQLTTVEDLVRIQVNNDYAGQRIDEDALEVIIDNRIENWELDHPAR